MLYLKRNEIGKIRYDERIVANIAKRAILPLKGKVWASTSKGRPMKAVSMSATDEKAFVDARISGNYIDVTVYIIVAFGHSIKSAAAVLDEYLREFIPIITGIQAGNIKVVITGVQAKKLTKRHIEVLTRGE